MIDFLLKRLGGNKYYSKLDLKGGFYHVGIKEEDKHKTAIITPFGLYEFNRMPMGLSNSPSVFQRATQEVFGDIPGVEVYIDDILIANLVNHMKLRSVFELNKI